MRQRVKVVTVSAAAVLGLLAMNGWAAARSDRAQRPAAAASLMRLPLRFEPNRGQLGQGADFAARGAGYSLFLSGPESVVVLNGGSAAGQPVSLRMRLLGSRPTSPVAEAALPGRSNYLVGNDPKAWTVDVPQYARVRLPAVYPGIDLVYYGQERQLEYDFVVAPGADPTPIRWDIRGADALRVDSKGDLVLSVAGGEVVHHAPRAYQEGEKGREVVAARFVLRGRRVAFALGAYDRARTLVIDPALSYSSYLGGTGYDRALDMVLDAAGNAYVTGETSSANFPTAAPFQSGFGGNRDAFVAKIDPSGSSLLYATYLGGSGFDTSAGIVIDGQGRVVVTGNTASANFPTVNPFQGTLKGISDAFVAQLSADGAALVFSTYIGGFGSETGQDVARDEAGNLYLIGWTDSTDFPTANAFQPLLRGSVDAYVTKLDPTASTLLYSTYLGGSSSDLGMAISVDALGQACVSGMTYSTDFNTFAALQPAFGGGTFDAFVTRLHADGSTVVYSTYLGGTGDDWAFDVIADVSGDAIVSGSTGSPNFPTASALQPAKAGGSDGFVSRLTPTGNAFIYSTFLGGNAWDAATRLVQTATGLYVAGTTTSTNFPVMNALQGQPASVGWNDIFVAKLSSAADEVLFSTYLGGTRSEFVGGLAVDAQGNPYVAGYTESTDFPLLGAIQGSHLGGTYDAFALKVAIDDLNLPPVANAGTDQVIEWPGANVPVTLDGTASSDPNGDPLSYTWRNASGAVVGTDPTLALSLGLGTHNFTLQVSDGRGGSGSDGVTVTVRDTAPPIVSITFPGSIVSYGSTVLVQWTASDNQALTSFNVAFSANGGASWTDLPGCASLPGSARSCSWLSAGPLSSDGRLRVRGLDASGNTGDGLLTLAVVLPPGPYRVKDIAVGTWPSWPRSLTMVAGTLFFVASDNVNGFELWKSDGTDVGTVMVKDINPGTANSSPNVLTPMNGLLYFQAISAANGSELWRSDGTPAGTFIVKDITPGPTGSVGLDVVAFDHQLYFRANDGIHGAELWKSDGTAAGTVMVKDIRPGSGASSPQKLVASGGTLFFTCEDSTANGFELWKTDGTEAGTVMVKDIYPGATAASPDSLADLDGVLLFSARDAFTGIELWRSDGTAAGTLRVKDINLGSTSSTPLGLTRVNGVVYFRATHSSFGTELWKSDGTAAGTVLVKDIALGSTPSSPSLFTGLGPRVLFSAFTAGGGVEPWVSDGSSLGTVQLKNIYPGGSNSNPASLRLVGDRVFFNALDPASGIELWQSDGTPAGTLLTYDFNPGSAHGLPSGMTPGAHRMWLSATNNLGEELWVVPYWNNLAPDAFAGRDVLAAAEESVTLDGSGSSDPDGDPLSYEWRSAGTPIGTSATLSLTALPPGTHEFTLTVSDGLLSSTDAVRVTVPRLTVTVSGEDLGTGSVSLAPPGSSCSNSSTPTLPVTCVGDYALDAQVTLTATPGPDSAFAGWSGACVGTSPTCQVTVTGDMLVGAIFRGPQTLTLQVAGLENGYGLVMANPGIPVCANSPGNDPVTCTNQFPLGTVVTLWAMPQPYSVFEGWLGACSVYGTAPTCEVTLTDETFVGASFRGPQILTLQVAGLENGYGAVMTDPPTPDCWNSPGNDPANCTYSFPLGTVVTLTAMSPDSVFEGWVGACSVYGTAPVCQVTLTDETFVGASFRGPQILTLQVASLENGYGAILTDPPTPGCANAPGSDPMTCAYPFRLGTVVTLTAANQPDSVFEGWVGACSVYGTAPTCQVTLTDETFVGASFRGPQILTLQVASLENGYGAILTDPPSPGCGNAPGSDPMTCAYPFRLGTVVTLTAANQPDSVFEGWVGACSVYGTAPTCQVTLTDETFVGASFRGPQILTLQVASLENGYGAILTDPQSPGCGNAPGSDPATCAYPFRLGTLVRLTATPIPDSVFEGWVGACSVYGTAQTCEVTLTDETFVGASFRGPQGLTLVLTGLENGSGWVMTQPESGGCVLGGGMPTQSCTNLFSLGTVVTLTATPGTADSVFDGWEGGACVGTSPTCQVTLTDEITVGARFRGPQGLTLVLTGLENGSGWVMTQPESGGCVLGAGMPTQSCTNLFRLGTVVTLTATPGTADSVFDGWEGGACVGTSPTCQVTLTDEITVGARFRGPQGLTLVLTGLENGSGWVMTQPESGGCVLGAGMPTQSCTNLFRLGTVVTLTATPGTADSVFDGWEGVACVGTSPTCQVTLTDELTVGARFRGPQGLTLVLTGIENGNGWVMTQPESGGCVLGAGMPTQSCTNLFRLGTVVTLTATPAPGSVFESWEGGACIGTSPTCQVTVTDELTVGARFHGPQTLTLVVEGEGSGQVQVVPPSSACQNTAGSQTTCAYLLAPGTLARLTAMPAADSLFQAWVGACAGQGAQCDLTVADDVATTAVFVLRNHPPAANAGGPYSGVRNQVITFSGSGSSDPDADALTYAWDFGDGATGTGVSPTHAYTALGPFTVTLTVNDGTVSSVPATTTVTISNQVPVANAGGPYTGVRNQVITFSGSGSNDPDADALTYTWDFGDGATGTGVSPTHAYTTFGPFTVTLTVNDGTGNSAPATATVTISNQVPVANAGGPYSGVRNQVITFSGSGSSDPDADALTYAWDFGDGATGTGVGPTHAYTALGPFTVTLTVNDGTGSSAPATTTVTIANQAPVANAGGPYSGVRNQVITFSGSGSSDPDADALTYAWDFGDGATGTGVSPTHAYATLGPFTVTLTVNDGTGSSAPATATVTISNQVPVANAGGPYSGVRNQAITFSGSGSSDPDADALTYAWDFGDGAAGTGVSPTHAYTTLGPFTVTLRVHDGNAYSDPVSVTATIANRLPTANAGGPHSGTRLQAIAFSGSGSSDPDGDALTYEWSFGDGATGTGVTPSHTYTQLGPFTVTLVVRDGTGASLPATTSVQINNVPPTAALTGPVSGSIFTAPATITLTASAGDADGSVAKVEFYAGANKLGEDASAPYSLLWPSVPAGVYSLSARATDDSGALVSSTPVSITVNAPPTVALTAPANGAQFAAPASITLTASASDADGTVAQVEFFRGTTSLGIDTTSPYSVTWSGAAAGAYTLSAHATDNRGATVASSPITVKVTATLAPTADAYVRGGSANANDNFGTATTLTVQQNSSAGSQRWTYVKINLASLPSITSAKLRLFGALSATTGTTVQTAVYPVSNTTWTETGITWNNKPASGPTALATVTMVNNSTAQRWYEWDVTAYLQQEKAAGRNVVTLVLKNLANSSPFDRFNSKEAASSKPELFIVP